jgi:hypothetical protein
VTAQSAVAGVDNVLLGEVDLHSGSYLSSVQEIPLEQLSDIKAKSIVEWIAHDRVRRSIVRHFRHFLMTYVDEHGASVYGQRILKLGEDKRSSTQTTSIFNQPPYSEL